MGWLHMSDTIRLEKDYKHAIETVWQAISNETAISKWFIKAHFKAEVGFLYTFTHDSTVINGQVKQVEPPHLLVYTWIVGNPDVETVVSWRLQQIESGTRLTLEHSGIAEYGDSAANFFNNFKNGWKHCMEELELYLHA